MDDYWKQPSGLDMIHANESEASLTLNVETHNVAPNADITQQGHSLVMNSIVNPN